MFLTNTVIQILQSAICVSAQHHIYVNCIYTNASQYSCYFLSTTVTCYPQTTCSEAVRHSGRSHLCLWQRCALQQTMKHKTRPSGKRGAPDTAPLPKNKSNSGTQSLNWRGQRSISYMLRYKWCFVRRLLTKRTVPFWCKTGSDQNTAKPVGQEVEHPDQSSVDLKYCKYFFLNKKARFGNSASHISIY